MNRNLSVRRRALSFLLALSLALGLLPGAAMAEEAPAGHWADGYLNQLVEWGFIRADQAKNPDRALTRADFMSIVNRAYGYHETGETPFEDVSEYDWFYDDVGIAYTARYINGTSPTTASPNDTLNRETAATILGRNMMLQESAGEILDFSDARNISNWARGTIKSSMEHYLVNGYDDGTFRPQKAMSWGEIAALVTRTIGTPLQDEGDYSLGGVFGNVTVTSPGVTLRDTVISGDLYITGGVGLGGIKLENVTVLGRIIASGTGSSESGASILLRNVTADELLVDNLQDNQVSIQADGITEIGKTTVRTSAYIEDNTPEGLGLHSISLEGDFYGEDEEVPEGWEPPQLTLAGRVEEVVNRTPNSTIHAAKGTVAKLTVDETAEGSNVVIDRGAVVKDLVLDTGVEVTGEGDVTRLEVNAPGSNVAMLPDQIVIRPGITADIAGEEMDSASADEFLLDPMILSGYPKAKNVAPTSLEAVFSTNKKGTIHWAVSAITDGSVGADDLLEPPAYGSIAVRYGTLVSPRGNEETIAQITGLTSNGSYYLSAVLEDAKGQVSPVKVISFTTPDNTVPAFNTGYPHMSKVSPKDSVVVVSPNKDCKLYYALMPEGATAPTEAELKTNAVSGALGYGVRDVQKNIEDVFRVNDQILEEKTNYILYLWLVDANGANKSAVISLPFTTDDETPPEFIVEPTVNQIQETSVTLNFRLNEDGTVYWVAVPAGMVYPKPEPGTEYDRAPLTSDYAKLQVSSGMNVGPDGKFGQVTATENTDGTITVSGLQAEKAYDFYYLAKDNAGPDRNYSVTVKKITINTLDVTGPKFTQRFSKTSGTDDTKNPKSDTDIYLDVSENIRYSGEGGGRGFLELYNDVAGGGDAARNKLAANLYGAIKLRKSPTSVGGGNSEPSPEPSITNTKDEFTEAFTIDYTKATVTSQEGGIRITFPAAGLHLENGAEYYFTIENVTDTSNNNNELKNPSKVDFKRDPVRSEAAGHDVWPFTVEPATVMLYEPGGGMLGNGATGGTMSGRPLAVAAEDEGRMLFFRMDPESTDSAIDTLCYDLLLWSDSKVKFSLYYRIVDQEGNPKPSGADAKTYSETTPKTNMLSHNGGLEDRSPDANGWIALGSTNVSPNSGSRAAASLNKDFNNCASSTFPKLNTLSSKLGYEFVIVLDEYEGNTEHTTWTDPITFYINVAAGQTSYLFDLARQMRQRPADNPTIWEDFLENKGTMAGKGGRSIGLTNVTGSQTPDTLVLSWPLDTRLPRMSSNPTFKPGAKSVTMSVNLDVEGYVTYVIAKARSNNGDPAITTTRNLLKAESGYPGTTNVTLKDNPPKELQPPESGMGIPSWMMGSTDDAPTSDNPQLDNTITVPSRFAVQSQTVRPTTNEEVRSGRFPCDGFVTASETITGLESETDYFAYFILEGGSGGDPSHVYIYQFRTTEDMKPKIRLNPQEETGYMERDINADHDATDGYYRMFTEADAANISIMLKPFKDWVEDQAATPNKYLKYTEGDRENTFTVLDALTTAYNKTLAEGDEPSGKYYPSLVNSDGSPDYGAYNDGYSVFDIYAGDGARSQIYTFLQTGQLISPETVANSVTTTPASSISTPATAGNVDWHEETLNVTIGSSRYVFLTYAVKSAMATGGNSANAYKKASFSGRAYQKGKIVPPEVINISGSWVEYDSVNRNYYGQVMINFEYDVYRYSDAGKIAITLTPQSNLFAGLSNPNPPFFKHTGLSTRSFTLDFTGLPMNRSLIFPANYFSNQNNDKSDKQLRIQMVTENGVNYLEVQWGAGTPWRIAVNEPVLEYQVNLTTGSGGTWGGTPTNRTLVIDAGKTTTGITPSVEPTGLTGIRYNWVITEGKDPDATPPNMGDSVISIDETTGSINALKPGTAVVQVGADGKFGDEPTIRVADPATITIIVRPKDPLSISHSAPTDTTVKWDDTTTPKTLTLTRNPNVHTPSVTFTVNPELGNTAEIGVSAQIAQGNRPINNYIQWAVNGNEITLTAGTTNTTLESLNLTLTFSVVKKSDQTPLSSAAQNVTLKVVIDGSITLPNMPTGTIPGTSR